MPLEVVLIHGDVFHRDDPLTRNMLDDAIDKQRRISIAEAIENEGDIEGHGHQFSRTRHALTPARAPVYKVAPTSSTGVPIARRRGRAQLGRHSTPSLVMLIAP